MSDETKGRCPECGTRDDLGHEHRIGCRKGEPAPDCAVCGGEGITSEPGDCPACQGSGKEPAQGYGPVVLVSQEHRDRIALVPTAIRVARQVVAGQWEPTDHDARMFARALVALAEGRA